MPVNGKTRQCKGFAFVLLPEHIQKEILKLNGITLENIIIVMDETLTRKRNTRNFQKHPKRSLVVSDKPPRNPDAFNSWNRSPEMETNVGAIQSKQKKKSYIVGNRWSFEHNTLG